MIDSKVPETPARVFHPFAKLFRLFSAHGAGGALRHLRITLLHRAHTMWDRKFHRHAKDDRTTAKVELHEVTISSSNRAAGVHYLPTPWRVLNWVHDALPVATRQWSFVDFGAGKGRVLLSAGRHPYGRVVGVEFAAELAQAARENIARAPGMKAGSIEVVERDATEFKLPNTPIVVFLFNPFGPPVIDLVAAAISRSYRRFARPIIIAYLNPQHGDRFANIDGFKEIKLPIFLAAKFGILSPYRLKLYATPEASAANSSWNITPIPMVSSLSDPNLR